VFFYETPCVDNQYLCGYIYNQKQLSLYM